MGTLVFPHAHTTITLYGGIFRLFMLLPHASFFLVLFLFAGNAVAERQRPRRRGSKLKQTGRGGEGLPGVCIWAVLTLHRELICFEREQTKYLAFFALFSIFFTQYFFSGPFLLFTLVFSIVFLIISSPWPVVSRGDSVNIRACSAGERQRWVLRRLPVSFLVRRFFCRSDWTGCEFSDTLNGEDGNQLLRKKRPKKGARGNRGRRTPTNCTPPPFSGRQGPDGACPKYLHPVHVARPSAGARNPWYLSIHASWCIILVLVQEASEIVVLCVGTVQFTERQYPLGYF